MSISLKHITSFKCNDWCQGDCIIKKTLIKPEFCTITGEKVMWKRIRKIRIGYKKYRLGD